MLYIFFVKRDRNILREKVVGVYSVYEGRQRARSKQRPFVPPKTEVEGIGNEKYRVGDVIKGKLEYIYNNTSRLVFLTRNRSSNFVTSIQV